MTLKLFFLLSVFSAVNANVLKGGEELDAHIEKRFYHFSKLLGKTTLTYAVDGAHLSGTMTKKDVYDGLEEAFDLWETVDTDEGSFKFIDIGSENVDQADIKIGFYKGDHHNDGMKFYGAGGNLAHAFAPGNDPNAGQIHFNGYQPFIYYREGDSRDNTRKTNFAWIAAHEIGHILGFGHSDDKNSIMRQFYPGRKIDAKLSKDDVEGLKDLLSTRGKCCFGDPVLCRGLVHAQECCNTVGLAFRYPRTISEKGRLIMCDDYNGIHPSKCPSGYYSGEICQDINECRIGFWNICGVGERCINTHGSYSCE